MKLAPRYPTLKLLIFLIALVGLVVLPACTTGPDYKKPEVDTPQQWASELNGGETATPPAVAKWWTTLNDPVLNDLVTRGLEANYDLRIAEARVREARAARGIVAAALWPTLNASASYTRSQSPDQSLGGGSPVSFGASNGPLGASGSVTVRGQNVAVTRSVSAAGATTSASLAPGSSGSFDRTNDLFRAGFDAAWELDIFGGNRRAIEAADAGIEATVEFRRDVLVSLASEIALNYIELRAAQNRLDITLQNIEAQTQTTKLTRSRFDAGLTSELDTVSAEAQLASTQSQVPMLETQVKNAIHRLSVLLGQEPGALVDTLQPVAALPVAPAEVPVGLPSDLLRRRADIRRAERELAAATARIGEAMADLFPKFYLTGGLSGQSSTLGTVLNGGSQLWNFGPGISWPILSGGRIRANIEVQNARQEQAALQYENAILLALEDVENGLTAFANEQTRRASLQTAVRANQDSVRIANERYVGGMENFLSVLQAEQRLFLSQDQLVQSESYVLTSLVSLYKALGGGWETEAE